MEAIITQEDIFNEDFKISQRVSDFSNLLSFAIINKCVTESQADIIIESYKEHVMNIVISNIEFDEEEDMNLEIENQMKAYFIAINDYLVSLKNPYQAIQTLFIHEPHAVIEKAKSEYDKKQVQLLKKVNDLKIKGKLIIDSHREYKLLVDYLYRRITNSTIEYPLYRLMDGRNQCYISSLDELEELVDQIMLELDILGKFKMTEVIKLIKSFDIVDLSKNITETAMYNYVFNAFYKDGDSIIFSDNMKKIIINDIKNGMFSVDDIIEIITNGDVLFSDKEKDYLLTYFIKQFKVEIIENKYIDRFVKTK